MEIDCFEEKNSSNSLGWTLVGCCVILTFWLIFWLYLCCGATVSQQTPVIFVDEPPLDTTTLREDTEDTAFHVWYWCFFCFWWYERKKERPVIPSVFGYFCYFGVCCKHVFQGCAGGCCCTEIHLCCTLKAFSTIIFQIIEICLSLDAVSTKMIIREMFCVKFLLRGSAFFSSGDEDE